MHISVVGLGKLGAPLAAVFASKGFRVVGTDASPAVVASVNAGLAPVDEPGLQALIDVSQGRLAATNDTPAAVAQTDATFIVVPTPSDSSGKFSNEHVIAALEAVGQGIRGKTSYHLVIVTSTVMPGSTDGELRDALERASRRIVGESVGLCYSPEFVALGSVVRDMLRPEVLLIGESDPRAGELLQGIYARSCDSQPVVRRMNCVNAELAKIAVNTFVTTKISYANMLSDLCGRIRGADVDVVTQAIGSDSRIGGKYLRGATGYGGPCFPRDNVAFAALARELGARADLAEATDAINRYQVDRVVDAVVLRQSPPGAIGVLGLSYKPHTAVVEQSHGMVLVERLVNRGYDVLAYDPQAMAAARNVSRVQFETMPSAESCVRSASLVVIMTPWPQFADIAITAFSRTGKRLTVIDCWSIATTPMEAVADIVYLGRGAVGTTPLTA